MQPRVSPLVATLLLCSFLCATLALPANSSAQITQDQMMRRMASEDRSGQQAPRGEPPIRQNMTMEPQSAPATQEKDRTLPVTSVTVFKDGHALIVHEGLADVVDGKVVLDNLPTPVLGTFWAWTAQDGVSIKAVVSGYRKTFGTRDITDLHRLLAANVGAQILIGDQNNQESYWATIERVLTPPPQELDAANARRAQHFDAPQPGSPIVLLRTSMGIRPLHAGALTDVTFRELPNVTEKIDQLKPALTLRLAGTAAMPPQVKVGYMYVQQGLRWIPQYRLDLDGESTCRVQLQATLVNDLLDLHGARVKLAVGAPPFAFAGVVDPIALQGLVQAAHPELQLNNNRMSQQVDTARWRASGSFEQAQPPPVTVSGERVEDLFIYDVGTWDLAKDERIVIQVSTSQLPYQDVYKLGATFAPPAYLTAKLQNRQGPSPELAPPANPFEVTHDIRLTNTGTAPLTTGLALLMLEGQLIGQTQMTYVSAGSTQDIPIGKALDINVKVQEQEIDRQTGAGTWNGEQLTRMDMKGSVRLTNRMAKAARVEVVRYALGNPGEISHDGKIVSFPMVGSMIPLPVEIRDQAMGWWTQMNWPRWWWASNSVCQFRWEVTVQPGATEELTYSWNYLWSDVP